MTIAYNFKTRDLHAHTDAVSYSERAHSVSSKNDSTQARERKVALGLAFGAVALSAGLVGFYYTFGLSKAETANNTVVHDIHRKLNPM